MRPRTSSAAAAGLSPLLAQERLHVMPPLRYLRSLGLIRSSRLALADTGGMQEETTGLSVPCLIIRDNTEWPIPINESTNMLIGSSPDAVRATAAEVLRTGGQRGRVPELWEGKAVQRVADETLGYLECVR